ncbi:MAG: MgtC/SapB family protein [Peptococcaceae bacterium]|nr:MAG: MgtC/SapB family protein [Peptococcaceae bacterium]
MTEQEIIIRLVLAVALGGFIGLERERLHVGAGTYSAGFRTHILVCVGAAVSMLVSEWLHYEFKSDAARVAAQVISGIGFLGAGAIMREGLLIRGLTTAASLWVVAAVGLAAGSGLYLVATFSTLLVLFALVILGTLEGFVRDRRKFDVIDIVVENRPDQISLIGSVLGMTSVKKIEVNNMDEDGKALVEVCLKLSPELNMVELVQRLAALPGVQRVEQK